MDSRQIILALKNSYAETVTFQLAASCCAATFSWLSLNREKGELFRPIYLLDFDVIASSVKTFAAVKLGKIGTRLDTPKTGRVFTPQDLIGPHTMRLVCSNLRDFCLPLGTKKELLEWHQRIRATDRGSQIRTLFKQAEESDDALTKVMRSDIAATVLTELEDIVQAGEDLSLLDHLLTNETPAPSLVSEPLEEPRRELNLAFDRLQATRPGFTSNNFSDALNLPLLFCTPPHPAAAPPNH